MSPWRPLPARTRLWTRRCTSCALLEAELRRSLKMSQRRIFSFLLTLFVAASFCLGLAFREVMAAVNPVLIAQGGLPERLARVRPVSVSGDMRPADTYSQVLSEL